MFVSRSGSSVVRRVGSSVAVVVAVAAVGISLGAMPAQAAGPTAGHSFSVNASALDSDPVLSWRDLTTGATGTYATSAAEPAISPDGTKIAAITQITATDRTKLSLIDVQTGAETVLDTPGADANDLDPAWSSDGLTVYFTRESNISTTDGKFVFSIPAIGGTATQAVVENALQPAPKPGGGTFAYLPSDNNTCAVKTLTGTTTTCVLDAANVSAAGIDGLFAPRWSPDGTKIALGFFNSSSAGVLVLTVLSGNFVILPAAGTADTATTFQVASTFSWTPDGSQVIYGQGTYDLVTREETDGGAVRSIDVSDGTHASTVQSGGNAGVDTWFPSVSSAAGSLFVPVDPVRIADTRTGQGGVSSPLGAGGMLDLTVTGANVSGSGLTVPTSATAVVLNVTVVAPTATSFLSVYPGPVSSPVPLVSNLNYIPGPNVANAVVVSVPAGGDVVLRNANGSTDVVVDIAGYYVPTSASDPNSFPYQPVTPTRILDTRNGTGAAQGAVGPAGSIDVQVTGGSLAVPSTAKAVVLNLTGIAGSAATFVSVFPTGGSTPGVSNLNLRPGELRANLVTVKVGTGGKVTLFNAAGQADLIADIAGYYDASAPDQFVPVAPLRIYDTRDGTYNVEGTDPIGPGASTSVQVRGTLTTSTGQVRVPAVADAVVFNFTGVAPSAGTFLAATPTAPSGAPSVSNLNLPAGVNLPNLAITKIGPNGQIFFYNSLGSTAALADLAGYFRP